MLFPRLDVEVHNSSNAVAGALELDLADKSARRQRQTARAEGGGDRGIRRSILGVHVASPHAIAAVVADGPPAVRLGIDGLAHGKHPVRRPQLLQARFPDDSFAATKLQRLHKYPVGDGRQALARPAHAHETFGAVIEGGHVTVADRPIVTGRAPLEVALSEAPGKRVPEKSLSTDRG